MPRRSRSGAADAPGRVMTPRRVSPWAAVVGVVSALCVLAAWAPHTSIKRVEVRVDDGQWVPATLAAAVSKDTWRQWTWPWQATTGEHTLTVRATDLTGQTQTSTYAPPAPNGSSGWDHVQVSVQDA